MKSKTNIKIKLSKPAEIILKDCMGIKKNESLLIVTDKNKRDIAEALRDKAVDMKCTVVLIEKKVGKVNGEEPEDEIAREMLRHDVILMPTTKSLSHTKARKNASKKGARIASMPGITADMMARAIPLNYSEMKKLIDRIKNIKKKDEILVTTKSGTALIMTAKGREWFTDYGIYTKKGNFGNLPAGEIALAPVEGTTNGVLVVDKTIGGIGAVDNPVEISIRNGHAKEIKGGSAATKLRKLLASAGKKAHNVAEIGIGTNQNAKITGVTLEDEKVMGTIHVAFGNSISFGGKVSVPIHLDCVVSKATVIVGEEIIMEDGKLLV